MSSSSRRWLALFVSMVAAVGLGVLIPLTTEASDSNPIRKVVVADPIDVRMSEVARAWHGDREALARAHSGAWRVVPRAVSDWTFDHPEVGRTQVHPVIAYAASPNGMQIGLEATAGTCSRGEISVRLKESKDVVVVAVTRGDIGWRPRPGTFCTMMAVPVNVVVSLRAPLDGRSVVDAVSGQSADEGDWSYLSSHAPRT